MVDSTNNRLSNEPPSLDDQAVLTYLQNDLSFFIRHAAAIEHFIIPHPVRDAISLPEWVMKRQRKEIDALKSDIQLIVEQAHENANLFDELIDLLVILAQENSLSEFLQALKKWAKKLGLADVVIRLFPDRWQLSPPLNAQSLILPRHQFEPIRVQRLGERNHYLGSLNGMERAILAPNTDYVGSVALSMLGAYGDLGIIMFISRSSEHYQSDMGTAMLVRLAQALPKLLTRWLVRA